MKTTDTYEHLICIDIHPEAAAGAQQKTLTLCDHWLWTECALSYNNKKVQRQQQRNSRRKTWCDHWFWIACGLLHINTKTQQQHRNSRRKTLCDDGLGIACGLSHRSRTLYCIYSPYSGQRGPVNNNSPDDDDDDLLLELGYTNNLIRSSPIDHIQWEKYPGRHHFPTSTWTRRKSSSLSLTSWQS